MTLATTDEIRQGVRKAFPVLDDVAAFYDGAWTFNVVVILDASAEAGVENAVHEWIAARLPLGAEVNLTAARVAA